jgi:hypothetical protein
MEINKYYTTCVGMCSLSFSACNARALIVVCDLAHCMRFLHIISLKAPFSKKNVIEHKTCFSIFSTRFVWNIFHSWKNWERCDQKCILVFMSSSFYSCPILMKLQLSGHSRNTLKYQISWKSVQWEPSCFMRTDGRTDMMNLIVAFRNFRRRLITTVTSLPYLSLTANPLDLHWSSSLFYSRLHWLRLLVVFLSLCEFHRCRPRPLPS